MIIQSIPTPADTLATIKPEEREDGHTVILAEVCRGPFTARVQRFDYLEDGRARSETPEVVVDSAHKDGWEMFNDLAVHPDHIGDFEYVTSTILSVYRTITATL